MFVLCVCTFRNGDEEKSFFFPVSKKDFKEYGVFVAVFLSHGDKDEILYSYDKPFNINHSFIHPIARNPTLNGKPKIFIIAACKGDQRNVHPPEDIYVTDSVPFYEGGKKPYMSELLKCYSTYEGNDDALLCIVKEFNNWFSSGRICVVSRPSQGHSFYTNAVRYFKQTR